MTIPLPFLVGLLVALGHRELVEPLPGECTLDRLLLAAMLLPVPTLAAWLAVRARWWEFTGRRSPIAARSWLSLSIAFGPVAVFSFLELSGYGDLVLRLGIGSSLIGTLLAVLPVYLVEMPRTAVALLAEAWLEVDLGARGPAPVIRQWLPRMVDMRQLLRLRFGWPLLALFVVAWFGVCQDLLQAWRPAWVWVSATSVGTSIAMLLFLASAASWLPTWFRIAFGVRRDLPDPHRSTLHATAAALHFRPDRVQVLPTGMRAINAMMVGPLPFNRLLCVTDGLLATLDERSLAGVVAHEIGHARMGHPGLLMLLAVVLPLLVLAPLRLFDIESQSPWLQVTVALAVLGATLLAVRRLAHRFEHEADVASVQALGAEPCSRALAVVSQLAAPPVRGLWSRVATMHPDERSRIRLMRAYEQDTSFRERFDRRGRTLRSATYAALIGAAAIAGWCWALDWPYERALMRFYQGDFVGARADVATLGPVPLRWRETWGRLQPRLAAAVELAPSARDWESARRALDASAWARGIDELLNRGPAAAAPWLAMALAAREQPLLVERAVEAWCAAAADGDAERVAALVKIVRRLGVPPELEPAFADLR